MSRSDIVETVAWTVSHDSWWMVTMFTC